jgi:hypothetical protein
MSTTLAQFTQPFAFERLQQIVVINGAIVRLPGDPAINTLLSFRDPEGD